MKKTIIAMLLALALLNGGCSCRAEGDSGSTTILTLVPSPSPMGEAVRPGTSAAPEPTAKVQSPAEDAPTAAAADEGDYQEDSYEIPSDPDSSDSWPAEAGTSGTSPEGTADPGSTTTPTPAPSPSPMGEADRPGTSAAPEPTAKVQSPEEDAPTAADEGDYQEDSYEIPSDPDSAGSGPAETGTPGTSPEGTADPGGYAGDLAGEPDGL